MISKNQIISGVVNLLQSSVHIAGLLGERPALVGAYAGQLGNHRQITSLPAVYVDVPGAKIGARDEYGEVLNQGFDIELVCIGSNEASLEDHVHAGHAISDWCQSLLIHKKMHLDIEGKSRLVSEMNYRRLAVGDKLYVGLVTFNLK